MKDKEMIEEMAKVLHDKIINKTWRAEKVAKELYEIAVPKYSVVLTREEYKKLTAPRLFIKPRELNKKELAEKLKNEKYGIIGVDESSIEIIPTRAEIEKETAEKFAKAVKDRIKWLQKWYNEEIVDTSYNGITTNEIDEILIQFSVEIKE